MLYSSSGGPNSSTASNPIKSPSIFSSFEFISRAATETALATSLKSLSLRMASVMVSRSVMAGPQNDLVKAQRQ